MRTHIYEERKAAFYALQFIKGAYALHSRAVPKASADPTECRIWPLHVIKSDRVRNAYEILYIIRYMCVNPMF
jgi:hypothetical protein